MVDEHEQNADYIALKSALSLLEEQQKHAQDDIVKLKSLKKEALSDVEGFSQHLVETGAITDAPKPQNVIETPHVSWEKYDKK